MTINKIKLKKDKRDFQKMIVKFLFSFLACIFIICLLPLQPSIALMHTSEETIVTGNISVLLLLLSILILLPTILFLKISRRELEKRTAELYDSNKQMEKEIIERKRVEEALRESEERYSLASQGANDGLWDWNLNTEDIYFSPRWKAMIGFGNDEIGKSVNEWFNRVHPDDIKKLNKDVADHLKGLTAHFENEHRMMNKDGIYLWMLNRGLAIRNEDGTAVRIAGSQTDITARKKAEEQLLHNAFYDALTELPNRALFIDRLGVSFAHMKRRKDYLFAVLFLDLDRFKNINDSFGHVIGDQLLVLVAERLKNILRLGDTVARFGGDEFTILLEDIKDLSDAVFIAERINKELAYPFNLNGKEMFINASIGIAKSETDYEQPGEILRNADTAMYRAKLYGKARYLVFDKTMHTDTLELFQLETDLRYAIDRQEFVIYYQPIISLETGKISGFEALVRWRHPERGLLLPTEFVPLAEETGQIVPIGLWVLREACQQVRKWQEQFLPDPPLTVSVNVSCKQFSQPDLVEQMLHILEETGLDPQNLVLEITESGIMQNAEIVTLLFSRLKALKVQLNIDDFGTGYSSLSYLHQFPINALKIDRSFVIRLGNNGKNSEVVRSIVELAHNMRMHVIAEGVESLDHLQILEALKCEYAQGYLFAHPLDSEAAEGLLANRAQDQRWMSF